MSLLPMSFIVVHQMNDMCVKTQSRKLSIVVQLNDPSEYEGGGLELEFDDKPSEPTIINVITGQGDIVVFPSIIKHRAVEVTKGTRYSATGWAIGPKFK